MKTFRRFLYMVFFLAVLGGAGFVFVQYYSFIFARRVRGLIVSIDRVQVNVSLLQQSDDRLNPQLFSFAVAIREDNGEIVTASAEDRQWAAAQRGWCAEAVYYPYPFWNVMKAGTYFNARLDRLFECPEKAGLLPPSPAHPSPGTPPASPTPVIPHPPPIPPAATPTGAGH
jgi:hypothetical protein